MESTVKTDRAAAFFSIACLIHCLALPLLAFALPALGVLAEWEPIHWAFAILAIGASLSVIIRAPSSRQTSFVVPSALGIALIVFGLGAEGLGMSETPPTVAGGLFLAFAHINRLRHHQHRV